MPETRVVRRRLGGLAVAGLLALFACSSEPEESHEETIARLTKSDEEIEAELAAEREAEHKASEEAAAAAASRETERQRQLDEHHRRLEERRAQGDPEAAAIIAERQRREAETKLDALTSQSAEAGTTPRGTSADASAPAAGDGDPLVGDWKPKFDALRAARAAKASEVAAVEREQADLTRRFQQSDITTERTRLQNEIGTLRAKLEGLRAEIQTIEREYADLQQQARRAGVPAVAYRDGVK